MNEFLKKNLKQKMDEKNLSISALERKAGLKSFAIRSIVMGRSKRPKIETLEAAAKILDCSVKELLSNFDETNPTGFLLDKYQSAAKKPVENLDFLKNILDLVVKVYNQKDYKPGIEQVIFVMKEAYDFSDKNQIHLSDEKFIDWIIGKCKDKDEK